MEETKNKGQASGNLDLWQSFLSKKDLKDLKEMRLLEKVKNQEKKDKEEGDESFLEISKNERQKTVWTDKQKKVLDSLSDHIIVSGGYASGKTLCSFQKFLNWLKESDGKGIVTGFSYHTLCKLLEEILTKLEVSYIFNSSKSSMETPYGGFYIYGMDNSRSQSRIRGLNLSCWYADEVTLQNESACLEVMARLRSNQKPRFIWTCNPESPYHWVYGYIKNKTIEHFTFKTMDNKHLPENYIKNLNISKESSQYLRLVLGKWVVSDDAPFRNIRLEKTPIKHWDFAYIDSALEGKDFTAVSLVTIQEGTIYVKGFTLKKSLALCIRFISEQIKDCHRVFYEKNGVGMFPYQEFLRQGISSIPCHTSTNKLLRILKMEYLVHQKKIVLDTLSDKEYIRQIINFTVNGSDFDDAPDSLASLLIKINTIN